MKYRDNEDREAIIEMAEYFEEELKISKEVAYIFSESVLDLLDIGDKLNDLDDITHKQKVTLRATLLSTFLCFLYGINIKENTDAVAKAVQTMLKVISKRIPHTQPMTDLIKVTEAKEEDKKEE